MAAYTSSLSAFAIGGTNIPAVGTMALSISRPPVDVTPIGVLNTYILSGIMTAVATIDVYYNATDHAALTGEILVPAGLTQVELFFNGTAGSTDVFGGAATIVSMDVVSVTSDVVRGSYTFQFYGPTNMNGVDSAIISGNETAWTGGV